MQVALGSNQGLKLSLMPEETMNPRNVRRPSSAMKRVRTALRLTQQEMSERIGLALSSVQNCERDERLPSSKAVRVVLEKMAEEAEEAYP